MSEKDRFDWNDDMDFDSETEGNEAYEDFHDPLDGFADYDDMSDYEDLPADDVPVADAIEAGARDDSAASVNDESNDSTPSDPRPATTMKRPKRRRGLSAMGLGFLFSTSILVAGVGIGGAILLAEGVHPRSLWQPENLRQIDQLLNFSDHPLNILYMVAMGVAFLALLGSYKMARVAAEANTRTREAEEMLDKVTALSLDRQDEWQSQEFKGFPPAEDFVMRTLGAWRLQEARQKRLMGVEGELHRLEKALNKNSRPDLTGRFDHPAVGRLADEMIRYFDARESAAKKLEDYQSRDRSASTDVLGLVQEARIWNGATLDDLGVQGNTLDVLARQMADLANMADKTSAAAGSTDGLTDIIEGIRKDLAGQPVAGIGSESVAAEWNDLVDRGSKLAFQIAMEVARLGPRGERLLPMSQSLEDLTTSFRQLADRLNGQDGSRTATNGLEKVHRKLETLAALITEEDHSPWRDLADEVQDYGPSAARIAATLTRMTEGFNTQEDRLVRVGTSLATMTGAEFDSSSIPRKESSDAPVSSLDFTRPEKRPPASDFGATPAEVDPFATAGSSFLSGSDTPADSEFSSSTLPEGFASPTAGSAEPEPIELEMDSPGNFGLGSDSPPDMPLSEDEEKVYDLEDFGASAAMEPDPEPEEEVFDLASFGASPVEIQEDPEPAEEVYDLADFGAAPLEPAAEAAPAAAEDEVYELSAFGALPLQEEGFAEPGDSPEEEPVFDLTDFGAKPMN